MFIVRKARNRDGQRAKDWINMAIGEIDNYNNPFEIIELSWKKNRVQRMAEYSKTRGFEDTEISDGPDGVNVTHIRRGNGSIMWERPFNGHGPFVGRIARTQFNMVKLAKCYRDDLWTIKNRSIDLEIRAMSDKLWNEMTPEQRAFNEERIKRLHNLKSEEDMAIANKQAIDGLGGDPRAMKHEYVSKKPTAEIPTENLTEERKMLFRKERELEEREARIKEIEEKYLKTHTAEIKKGKPPIEYRTVYTTDQLRQMKPTEIRRVARVEFGITLKPADDRTAAIEKIVAIQRERTQKEEPELVTG